MGSWRSVLLGIGQVAGAGVAFALMAGIAYLADGERIVRAGGMPYQDLVLVYTALTVVCGAILGLLRPYARGLWRTALVAAVVAWPAALVVVALSDGNRFGSVSRGDLMISVGIALFAGPVAAGFVLAKETREPR